MALSLVLTVSRLNLHCESTAFIRAGCGVFTVQVRGKRSYDAPSMRRRRRPYFPQWWLPRDRKYFDEYLTQDNQEFIQEVIKDKYLEPGESPLKRAVEWEKGVWEPGSRRTGLIARKIGVYPMWTKSGKRLLTTLLQVVDNHVIKYHPPEEYAKVSKNSEVRTGKIQYGCIVVGAESGDPQRFTAQYNGLFTEAGVIPKKKLTKFVVTPNAALPPGTPLYASHFRVGDYVDVGGVTIDQGFQGVVRRWGMKGGPASHGCTKAHRKMGSTGGGKKHGIWKGKHMAGHMGGKLRWLRGLKIWRINTKYNVLWVQGPAIAGDVNSFVFIADCNFEKHRKTEGDRIPPFPTHFPEDDTEPLPEELLDPELHGFSDPSVTFEQKEVSK